MQSVPFLCPRCGTAFGDGGIHIEGDVTKLTLVGNTMTCPNCGTPSPMALPDGTYNVRGGRFELVRLVASTFFDAHPTWDDIRRLDELLAAAREPAPDPRLTADRIVFEIPAFAALADAIREQQPDRVSQMLAAISILIAVLAWLFPRSTGTGPIDLKPQQIEKVIEETVHRLQSPVPTPVASSVPTGAEGQRRPGRPPARNASCPCGSGLKFKRCCGSVR